MTTDQVTTAPVKKAKRWRGVAIGAAVVAAIFLLIVIIVPLLIDIDQYRPEIEQAANDRLNGHLSLGRLSLSLWGKVEVGIDRIELSDLQGNKVMAVETVHAL